MKDGNKRPFGFGFKDAMQSDIESVAQTAQKLTLASRLRRGASAGVIDNFFIQLATLSRYQPYAQAHRHNVELIRDVPYLNSGSEAHTLDIYRPTAQSGPWPIVLYVHGGGFRILSKDTHWLMALAFAKRGYLVFNINYRLAPEHPFPAAMQDTCAALRWITRNAAAFGGDINRLVLAGESAGGNLVTALSIATTFERPEPWARQAFELDVVPRAVVPACGLLQVSQPERFMRNSSVPWSMTAFENDYIGLVSEAYLPGGRELGANTQLADPLCIMESNDMPARSLPAFFVPVGTRDPILDDSRRLAQALERRGADVEAKYYDGELHAFHAFIWRKNARACWRDTFDFLAHRLDAAMPAKSTEVQPWIQRAHLRST